MGALSPKDERQMLIGCLILLAVMGLATIGVGFGIYSLIAWLMS